VMRQENRCEPQRIASEFRYRTANRPTHERAGRIFCADLPLEFSLVTRPLASKNVSSPRCGDGDSSAERDATNRQAPRAPSSMIRHANRSVELPRFDCKRAQPQLATVSARPGDPLVPLCHLQRTMIEPSSIASKRPLRQRETLILPHGSGSNFRVDYRYGLCAANIIYSSYCRLRAIVLDWN